MKRRSAILAPLLAAALLTAGCGGSDGPKTEPGVAQAAIAKAAGVRLAAVPVPDDAKDQGLKAAYSNQASAATDKQVVFLFVLDDAGTVDELSDQLEQSVPGETVRSYEHGNVLVVYGAAGTNRGKAVQAALDQL